jgi:hypothetical protein
VKTVGIYLLAVALVCIGCANQYAEELAGFKQAYISRWGPERNWSKRQSAQFIHDATVFHNARMRGQMPVYKLPEPTPTPPSYRAIPDGRGGFILVPE